MHLLPDLAVGSWKSNLKLAMLRSHLPVLFIPRWRLLKEKIVLQVIFQPSPAAVGAARYTSFYQQTSI